jgi:hypothetical protein
MLSVKRCGHHLPKGVAMTLKYLPILAIAMTTATVANAQEFVGGEVGLSYSMLTDSDLETSGIQLNGSVEISVNRELSVQGDISHTDGEIGGLSGDISSIGLHGIYHANENASFGAYLGSESSDGADATFYGVEAGYGAGNTRFDGYFGVTAVDSGDPTIGNLDVNQLGFSVGYAVTDSISMTGRYDRIRFTDALTAQRYGIGAELQASQSISIGTEVGILEGSVLGLSGDESYANVTATYNFGAQRGATFESRGLLSTILGF